MGHEGIIASVAFVPGSDGALTVSPNRGQVDGDATMRLWDLDTGREIARVQDPDDFGFWSVAVAPDHRHVITGGPLGSIRLWRLPDPPMILRNAGNCPLAAEMPGEVRILSGHSNLIERDRHARRRPVLR